MRFIGLPKRSTYPRTRYLGLGQELLEYRFWVSICLLGTGTIRIIASTPLNPNLVPYGCSFGVLGLGLVEPKHPNTQIRLQVPHAIMIVERSYYSGRGPSGVDRLHPKISHRLQRLRRWEGAWEPMATYECSASIDSTCCQLVLTELVTLAFLDVCTRYPPRLLAKTNHGLPVGTRTIQPVTTPTPPPPAHPTHLADLKENVP